MYTQAEVHTVYNIYTKYIHVECGTTNNKKTRKDATPHRPAWFFATSSTLDWDLFQKIEQRKGKFLPNWLISDVFKGPPFFLSKEVASNWCSPKISRKFHEITYVHLMCFIYLLGGGNMEISRLFEPPGTSGTWDTHGALELARPRGEDRLGWTHLGVTSEILWIP